MGGHLLIHLFEGPSAKDVIGQLSAHVGRMPRMPPLWATGYHACRGTGSGEAFKETVANNTAMGIPYDSDCIDELLVPTAFSVDTEEFPDFADDVQSLVSAEKAFVPSMHAQVADNDAPFRADFFVKSSAHENATDFEGSFNGRSVVVPDFTHPETAQWWSDGLSETLSTLGNTSVGLSLVHNSPFVKLNGSQQCKISAFTHVPKDISTIFPRDTVCPEAAHHGGVPHLSLHNTYPQRQLEATIAADVSSFTFTRHFSAGAAAMGGVYGSDFFPTWANLRKSLKEVMELGLSGFPLVSMTACGVEPYQVLNTTESINELCLRWYQVCNHQ